MNDEKEPRTIPRNELDLQMMSINAVWGTDDVSNSLRERLTQYVGGTNGELYKRELWGLLSYFTRDIRLANLDKDEIVYCNYYLTLAGDLLNDDFIEPFMICLNRVASVLDLSQSKKGFLRKLLGSFSYYQYKSDEPPKMGLFNKTKKE